MIETLISNWILLMICFFLLTSSSCVTYHVTRKERMIFDTRIDKRFDRERQKRIQLGLEPLFVSQSTTKILN